MAANKVTFTLDDETVRRIADSSERLAKPKSQVVREAVADYHSRIGRLSESERQRLLKIFDTVVPLIPSTSATRGRSGVAGDPPGAAIRRKAFLAKPSRKHK